MAWELTDAGNDCDVTRPRWACQSRRPDSASKTKKFARLVWANKRLESMLSEVTFSAPARGTTPAQWRSSPIRARADREGIAPVEMGDWARVVAAVSIRPTQARTSRRGM